MRLSTSTCIYFNRPDGSRSSIQKCVELCAEAGYKVMDMSFHDCSMFPTPFQTDEWERWLQDIRATADRCGIEFSQGHSHFYNYCSPNTPNAEWQEELVRRSIIGAEILGIKWLAIHAATDFDSATACKTSKEKALEYFKPHLELAAKHNVGYAIENLWELNISPTRRYTSTAEEVVDLVDDLPYDNVGICWDAEHAGIMKQNQLNALKLVGDRLKATHISDFTTVQNDHLLPFSGTLNWQELMDAFKAINYQGDFTYEIFRYTTTMPETFIPEALRHSVKVGECLLSL
ncbi:MAG: sugar phosphate isomerase/epimerase [Angelakisella sp.]